MTSMRKLARRLRRWEQYARRAGRGWSRGGYVRTWDRVTDERERRGLPFGCTKRGCPRCCDHP